jgi:hypothetical protein
MNEQGTLKRPIHLGAGKQTEVRAEANENLPRKRSMGGPVALDTAAGAAAGAMAGVIAGPPGIAIGAVIGGIVGGAAGIALKVTGQELSLHDEQLDRDIGVSGGNLGEASPTQPPSHGLLHSVSLGLYEGSMQASDGPMQNVDSTDR